MASAALVVDCDHLRMRAINSDRILDVFRVGANRVVGVLERELFPRRCVFCGSLAQDDERFVCVGCYAELPWIQHACPTCAEPIVTGEQTLCAECQTQQPPFVATIAPLEYTFPIDSAIKAMKYHRKLHYVPAFWDILSVAARGLPADIDAVLPVPLHRWRQLRRGFNQAVELALPLRKQLSAPLMLRYHRARPRQV